MQAVICISKSINHFFGMLYSTTFSLLFLDWNDPSSSFLVLFRTLVFTHSRVLPLKQAFLSSTYCTEANKEPINLGHIIQKRKALAINHASSCKPKPSSLARRSPKKCGARPSCVARVLLQQQQQLVVVVFVTVHWQAQKPSAFLKVIRPGGNYLNIGWIIIFLRKQD